MTFGHTGAGDSFSALSDTIPPLLIGTVLLLLAAVLMAAAAAMLLRVRFMVIARRQAAFESDWKPRIVSLVVSARMVDAPDPVTQQLLQDVTELPTNEQRILLELLVQFAFIVTGGAREQLCRVAEPALPVAAALLDERDPALRAIGVHILGRLGLARYEQAVLRGLEDRAPLVATTAAGALAATGSGEYVEPILAMAARLPHWATSEIVSILRDIGPSIIPQLRSAYADTGRSTKVRVVCAGTLRWLNDLAAAGIAVEILRYETGRELLAASLRLLRRVGTIDHVPAIRHLCTSHDSVVRLTAISALAAAAEPDDCADADRLATAVADPTNWVAIRAARGLRELGRPEHLRLVLGVGHARSDLVRDVWPGLDGKSPTEVD